VTMRTGSPAVCISTMVSVRDLAMMVSRFINHACAML